jgi:sugar lactone lactonase YvrE
MAVPGRVSRGREGWFEVAPSVDSGEALRRPGRSRVGLLLAVVVAAVAIAAVSGAASAEAAARFYWYGENNSTCWKKTGEVAAEAPSECDGVGEWFLNSSNPVRTLEGAYPGDLQITQSGDYCNAYTKKPPLGPLYTRDANNESGLTGFNPSPPDNMTTENGDFLCQALGAQWGQGVRPGHIPGNCVGEYQPCGVHHAVSFVGQAQSIRPWSNSFVNPILIVEGAAYPGRVNVPGGGWAYLCPIIEDVGSSNGQLLEYCFVEWEKSGYVNFRGLVNQAINPSNANGHRSCQIFTAFQLGTSFSTEIAGSGNTYTIGESPWIGPFKAGITEGNLLNAIKAANAPPCSEGLSENLQKYALIGVEQGIEGANIGEFGAHSENLSLSTEYFGLNVAPRASTQPTNEWGATSAEVHGAVNPEGSATEAYFEYSTEPSFAHSVKVPYPGWSIGSGMTYIPAYTKLEGLTPNTLYYDRVVGHNASGTTPGEAVQFHTLAIPPTPSTPLPAISGSAIEGQHLTTSNGTWGGGAVETYTYQWQDCNGAGEACSAISGATSSGYTLAASDVGHTIRVVVTAHNTAGSASETSAATAVVTAAATLKYSYLGAFGSSGSGAGQFSHPAGVALDSEGHLWALDQGNDRVEEFSESGEVGEVFGSAGSSKGQLNEPSAITVDSKGKIWVLDSGNYRVEQFSSVGKAGKILGSQGTGPGQFSGKPEGLAADANGNIWVSNTYSGNIEEFNAKGEYVKSIGKKGTGTGELEEPKGLAIGANGNIWVADWKNDRIVEFSESGAYVAQFGTAGSGNGQLNHPYAVAVDAHNDAWVIDVTNSRVQEFGPGGEYIAQFGSSGAGAGQFSLNYPVGLAVSATRTIWVTDSGNNRIEKWGPSITPSYLGAFGSSGSGAGQFSHPAGVALDSEGHLWALDQGNDRVEEFSESGEVGEVFGSAGSSKGQLNEPSAITVDSKGKIWVLDSGNYRVEQFSSVGKAGKILGSQGTGPGQFSGKPEGLAADANGNIWVSNTYSGNIEEFNAKGEYVKSIGKKGTGTGELEEPKGLAIGANGNIWVADWKNNRIVEFDESGSYVAQFGTTGSGNGQLNHPYAVAVDAHNDAWVMDVGNSRVQEFGPSGEYIAQFGSSGSGAGQFSLSYPVGLAVSASRTIWVTDSGNNRIEKWE